LYFSCHKEREVMITIFVGNLPNDTQQSQAEKLFSSFGEVGTVDLTLTDSTHRFQGYGFVEMDEGAARAAIAELDGSVYEGAILCVSEATPAQLAQRDGAGDEPDPKADLDDIAPSNLLRRYYQVASVEKIASPVPGAGDDWYRYELRSGPSSITGMHRGTLQEVTDYATECAAAFNMRSMKGKSARSMAPARKKKVS
jgi:RNA recognition motif-containing protein